jgi:ribosome-binding protein aMBF1 (putative translation factor)
MKQQKTIIFKNKFHKGSAVYTCEYCGKKTRDTGIGEASVNLCKSCYQAIEKENAENENTIDLTPYGALEIKRIAKLAYETGNYIQ